MCMRVFRCNRHSQVYRGQILTRRDAPTPAVLLAEHSDWTPSAMQCGGACVLAQPSDCTKARPLAFLGSQLHRLCKGARVSQLGEGVGGPFFQKYFLETVQQVKHHKVNIYGPAGMFSKSLQHLGWSLNQDNFNSIKNARNISLIHVMPKSRQAPKTGTTGEMPCPSVWETRKVSSPHIRLLPEKKNTRPIWWEVLHQNPKIKVHSRRTR